MKKILVSLIFLMVAAANATPLSENERLQIEYECARLSALYAQGLDRPDAVLFASIFAKNAVWQTGAGRYEGRRAILDYVSKRSSHSKHAITNILVDTPQQMTQVHCTHIGIAVGQFKDAPGNYPTAV